MVSFNFFFHAFFTSDEIWDSFALLTTFMTHKLASVIPIVFLVLFELYNVDLLSMEMTKKDSMKKTFYFIRHGITETNEFMHGTPWGSDGFRDPGLFDTRLSKAGVQQCQRLHNALKAKAKKNSDLVLPTILTKNAHFYPIDFSNIKMLISSPLTRTLQTTTYIFNHEIDLLPPHVPKITHPLLAERVYMSSDTGRLKSELTKEFPDFVYDHMPDEKWWFDYEDNIAHNVYPPSLSLTSTSSFVYPTHSIPYEYEEWRPKAFFHVPGEPTEFFRQRMLHTKSFLLSLPTGGDVVVVSHWGVIRALTGKDVSNCELTVVQEEELLDEPFVD